MLRHSIGGFRSSGTFCIGKRKNSIANIMSSESWNMAHSSSESVLRPVTCFANFHVKRYFCSNLPSSSQTKDNTGPSLPAKPSIFNIRARIRKWEEEKERRKFEQYGKLIYDGKNKGTITRSKFFSLFAVTAVIGMEAGIIMRLMVYPNEFVANEILLLSGTCVLATILMILPIYLNHIVQRAVLQMYFKEETQEFTAVAYGTYLNKKVLQFRPEELVDPGHAAPMTTVMVGKHPILFDTSPKAFKDRQAFEYLMGFGQEGKRIPELLHEEAVEIHERIKAEKEGQGKKLKISVGGDERSIEFDPDESNVGKIRKQQEN